MIGLQKDGQAIITDESFSIDWVVEDDILDFEKIGSGYSWTVQIPIRGNEWAFHYASDPARVGNKFRTYDDFQLTWSGNVWWHVSVLLNGVNESNTHYEVVLTEITDDFKESLELSIRQLVEYNISEDDYGKGVGAARRIDIRAINADESLPVYFPICHFDQFPHLINASDIFTLPWFSILWLLKLALDKIGYTYIDSFSTSATEYHKLICASNEIENGFNYDNDGYEGIIVQNYIPDITLKELIQGVIFFTGSRIKLDLENKQLVIESIDRLTSKTPLDLSELHHPNVQVSKPDVNNLKIEYTLDKKMVQSTLEGVDVGPFETLADFIAGATLGEYGFVHETNAWHGFEMWDDDPADFTDKLVLHPFQSYETGADSAKSITTVFVPVMKTKYTFFEVTGSFDIIDNGFGKVRLSGPVNELGSTAASSNFQIAFDEKFDRYDITLNSLSSDSRWSEIDSIDSTDYEWVDTDLDFSVASAATKIYIRQVYNFYFPYIGDTMHASSRYYQSRGFSNTKFSPRIALWHGVKSTTDAATLTNYTESTHGLALPDQYYNAASEEKLGSLSSAIISGAADSFLEQSWVNIYNFITSSRNIRLRTYMSNVQIKRLIIKSKVGAYLKGRFVLKSFKAKLGKNITNQEIEGYII